jgi:hypothetical protein
MQRRHFLSLCGFVAGSCLVPGAVARVIRETCILAREPFLVLPRYPSETLYALSLDGKTDFMLHLGDPFAANDPPTWRDYLDEFEGIDIEDKDAVEEWWREQVEDPDEHRSAGALGVDPADAGPAGRDEQEGASQHPITLKAKDTIDGIALEKWENEQEMRAGPAARAFHHLSELPLDDGSRRVGGQALGKLRFIEGDRPGSNLTYVEAPDLATLACLQNRLNEIGENLAIEIRGW